MYVLSNNSISLAGEREQGHTESSHRSLEWTHCVSLPPTTLYKSAPLGAGLVYFKIAAGRWNPLRPFMFSALGLFRNLPCPQLDTCKRPNCLYSHSPKTFNPKPLNLVPRRQPVASGSASRSAAQAKPSETVPAKRPAISPIKSDPTSAEPPRKLQKVGPTQRPVAVKPSTSAIEVCAFETHCNIGLSYI